MKYCPTCQRTYPEGAQRFCLQDGTPLVDASASPTDSATPNFNAPPPGGAPPPPPGGAYNAGGYNTGGQGPTPGGSYGPTPGNAAPSWQGAPTPRKRKVWPWVLGIVGVLVVGFVALLGVGGFLLYKYGNKQDVSTSTKDTKTYVNSRTNFGGKLSEHYADFSFNYPASWTLDPQAGKGDSPNFVKVERAIGTGDNKFTLENFAVGWYTSTGTMEGDRTLFPQLASQLSAQFQQGFPEYRKVSEGETRVGKYNGYEFRFESVARNTAKGDVNLWGRVVLVPSGSITQRNGVALVMIASSLASQIKSVQDVGAKGEMPVILNSFNLGGSTANGANGRTSSANSGTIGATGTASTDDDATSGTAPTDKSVALNQLRQLEEEWAEANINGDREALANILADEYIGISGDGSQQKKADYLSTLQPDSSVKSQTFKNLDLSLRGNTATLTGSTDAKFANGNTQTFRFTDTFTWRDGRWQAVSSHASPVQ